jgi:hypothetical protein
MKPYLSLSRAVLFALALGTASVTAAFADDTSTTSDTSAPKCSKHHHFGAGLTADEKAQLKKDYTAALAADPSLQTDKDSLKKQFEALKTQGKSASKDDWKALHEQSKAFHQKLDTAMTQADPNVAPILAKLKAAHKKWHHHSDANSDSSTT